MDRVCDNTDTPRKIKNVCTNTQLAGIAKSMKQKQPAIDLIVS